MDRKQLLTAVWRANKPAAVLTGALLLVNIAGYLLLSQLYLPRLEELERTYIRRQEVVRHSGQQAGGARTPGAVYRQGQIDLAAFREAIPPREEFTAWLGELFALAGKAGLSIDRVQYDPKEVAEKGLLRYTLNFSVAGSYAEIKRFIFSLEQSPRIVVIEEVSLSRGEQNQGEVGLRIRLATYFQAVVS